MVMGGDGPMDFMHIIVDFFTLGTIGLFSTITLALWYEFCEIFIFDQGYLQWLRKFKILKALIILSTGIILWGTALWQVHHFLWDGAITP